jgi:hypothetical protein
MSLAEVTSLATVIGVAIALATLIKGVLEYSAQGAQKRAEHFREIRKRLKENDVFKEISFLLETDDPKLQHIPFPDKRDFLGLFEEVAIAMNSRLIHKEVALYMFGYYAVRCWRSQYFWSEVNRRSPYWALFGAFATEMEHTEEKSFRLDRLRF